MGLFGPQKPGFEIDQRYWKTAGIMDRGIAQTTTDMWNQFKLQQDDIYTSVGFIIRVQLFAYGEVHPIMVIPPLYGFEVNGVVRGIPWWDINFQQEEDLHLINQYFDVYCEREAFSLRWIGYPVGGPDAYWGGFNITYIPESIYNPRSHVQL